MGAPSTARRDARRHFLPGYEPSGYPKGTGAYYKSCYDKEWRELQKEFDQHRENESQEPELTLEERVTILEEQVRLLREAGGL